MILSVNTKTEEVKQDKDDIINIFSVASGHLYERFLRLVLIIGHMSMNLLQLLLFREKGFAPYTYMYMSTVRAVDSLLHVILLVLIYSAQ